MRWLPRILLSLSACLATTAPALAAEITRGDDLRAQFGWHLDFGSSAPSQAGYGLAVGYRAEADSPVASLFRFDVDDNGALARLAGLPLYERAYRADQNESDAPGYASTVQPKPWYARSWVMWTLGGIAVTTALASGAGDSEYCTGYCDHNDSGGGGVTGASTGDDGTSAGCVNGQCAVQCTDQTDPTSCVPFTAIGRSPFVELSEGDRDDLELGTGGMGDLIAR